MSESKLVQFECPIPLLEEFDEAMKAANFKKRAEALRHLIRSFVEKHKEASE